MPGRAKNKVHSKFKHVEVLTLSRTGQDKQHLLWGLSKARVSVHRGRASVGGNSVSRGWGDMWGCHPQVRGVWLSF